MGQGITPKGVLLGAAMTAVVILGTAAAASGRGVLSGVFELGRTNSVNATSTLESNSTKTLQLVNSGSGPALALHVQKGEAPISTNSQIEVQNLNSALVDGENASDFQEKSDDVRLSSSIDVGAQTSFQVGPLITFMFSCAIDSTGVHAKLSLLNNAPPKYGYWYLTYIALDSTASQPADGAINSGDIGIVTDTTVQGHFNNEDFVTMVWEDSTETISATYEVQAFDAGSCNLFGTAVRTS